MSTKAKDAAWAKERHALEAHELACEAWYAAELKLSRARRAEKAAEKAQQKAWDAKMATYEAFREAHNARVGLNTDADGDS